MRKIDEKTLFKLTMNEEFQNYYEKAFPTLWNYVYTEIETEDNGDFYYDGMFRVKTMRVMMSIIQDVINREFSYLD